MRKLLLATTAVLGLACFGTTHKAQAAAFFIDDTTENVTVTLNDFEGGFSINGTQVQSGLGNLVTVPVGESFSFSGAWIAAGQQTTGSHTIVLIEPGTGAISDVLSFTIGTAPTGGLATISGSFCSDSEDPQVPACTVPDAGTMTRLAETGQPIDFSQAFLSASFQSDVEAPEPATLALLGVGLAGLAATRRRKAS